MVRILKRLCGTTLINFFLFIRNLTACERGCIWKHWPWKKAGIGTFFLRIYTGREVLAPNALSRLAIHACTTFQISRFEYISSCRQHYELYRVRQTFTAWSSMCRDRGSILRRVSKFWRAWAARARKRKNVRDIYRKAVRWQISPSSGKRYSVSML